MCFMFNASRGKQIFENVRDFSKLSHRRGTVEGREEAKK